MKSFCTFILVLLATSVAQGAELQLANVAADRTTAAAGEQIAVSCEVVNNDPGTAAASRLKYYFSQDAAYDNGDRYLNYDKVGELAAYSSSNETANVRVPHGTADGAYYILLIADFNGEVFETNEDDNVFAMPVTVGETVLEQGPDLTVQQASTSVERAYPGESFGVDVEVVNLGAAAADSQLNYYLSSDRFLGAEDVYLNYDKVPSLGEGDVAVETASLTVPTGTEEGLYFVLSLADSKDALAEVDETNNLTATPLIVGDYTPLPDLRLLSFELLAATVRPGETIPVQAVVHNAGDLPSAESKLKYFLSADALWDSGDKQLSYDKVNALGVAEQSDESANLRVRSATDAGSWYVLFVADAEGSVDELDESDNVAAVPVEVVLDQPGANLGDLVLEGAALSASEVSAGTTVDATVTIRNQGSASADASRLKYFLSTDTVYDLTDPYLNYDNIGELLPDASLVQNAALGIPEGLADGDYYVLVVADETEEVEEQYESNNVLALPLAIGPYELIPSDAGGDGADLMVVDAQLNSVSVRAGERATLQLAVENVGTEVAAASKVKYYLSRDAVYDSGDKYVGYDNVPELAAGDASEEGATPKIPATTDGGSWYFVLVADASELVSESFESNNVSAVAVQVLVDNPEADAADLVLTDESTSKSTVGAGYKIGVELAVGNEGTQPAAESRLKLYLSQDDILGPGDVFLDYRQIPGLAVDEEHGVDFSARIPAGTALGSHHLLLVADVNRELEERYESNNLVALPITVSDSDSQAAFPYVCPDSLWTDEELLAQGTVATINTLHLGWDNSKDLTSLACVVAHFDVVGLLEIDNAQGLAALELELESLTGEAWGTHLSETPVGNKNGVEYYGYAWRSSTAEMTGALGLWDDPGDTVKREPYGANFRIGNFDFTLVVFHLQYGKVLSTRRGEAAQLIAIYDYFQTLNGSEQDVLIGGDFNLPGNDSAFTIVGHDGIDYITDPEQKTSIGAGGLVSSFDNIFFSSHSSEYIASGAYDFTKANHSAVRETVSDHIPVWMAFDTTVDDD